MAVDPESAQVYWTDRKAGRIQRLTLKCPAGTLEARWAEGWDGPELLVNLPSGGKPNEHKQHQGLERADIEKMGLELSWIRRFPKLLQFKIAHASHNFWSTTFIPPTPQCALSKLKSSYFLFSLRHLNISVC